MSAIIFLIFLGIVVAGGFLAAFIWAVRSGQYDDDYSPSVRILFDNTTPSDNDSDTVKQDTKQHNSSRDILKTGTSAGKGSAL